MSALTVQLWLSIFSMLAGNLFGLAGLVLAGYTLLYVARIQRRMEEVGKKLCDK